MSGPDISGPEVLEALKIIGAIYGLIFGVLALTYMVTRPSLAAGVIGGAFTALSLIAFGAASALVVATVATVGVVVIWGIVRHAPRLRSFAEELADDEPLLWHFWDEMPETTRRRSE